MSQDVVRVSIKIFSSNESRFGYTVTATKEDERDYFLSCVSKPVREHRTGRDVTLYPLWIECADRQGNIIYSSQPFGIATTAEEAGSRTYAYARSKLSDDLAEYILKKTALPYKPSNLRKHAFS